MCSSPVRALSLCSLRADSPEPKGGLLYGDLRWNLSGFSLRFEIMETLGSPQGSSSSPLPLSPSKAFNRLLVGLPKKKTPEPSKFVKKLDDIPAISLPPETPMQVALSLSERALIGQFTGLWPSPKTTESWVSRNWMPLIRENVTSYFLGRGYFLFEFTVKEDKDLIFPNDPYFMGPQGLYLNKWTTDFDPAVDVPNAVPVWVRLPNLLVHC